MKKFLIALLCVCSLFAVSACKDKTSGGSNGSESTSDVEITSGEESQVKIYLNVETLSLSQYASAEIFCSHSGSTETAVWSIAEGGEAFISLEATEAGCKINGLSVGETAVTVSVGEESKTVPVTVTQTLFYPTLQLTQNQAQPKVGGSITIGAELTLDSIVLETDVSFVSMDESIAQVSPEGVILGVSAGETTVEVRVEYNGELIVEVVQVTVVA